MRLGDDTLLAVLSDAHGNAEALRAVLADVDACGARALVFLGDAVGYGPDPEEVVALLRGRGASMVLGNHEDGVLHDDILPMFNPQARQNVLQTRKLLSKETLAFLAELPTSIAAGNARFVHGCPPDDPHKYLFEITTAKLRSILHRFHERICFVGHTHEMRVLAVPPDGASGQGSIQRTVPGEGERYELRPDWRYVVNVGAVGQPRDGDNRAKYVLWDRAADTLEFRRVDYDYRTTAKKILERGFHERYADRLL